MAALINWKKPETVPIPRRNLLAYPLAPFLGFGGAGMAAVPMMIAAIGIMAAIAIPQFQQYRARAASAAAKLPSATAEITTANAASAQVQAMDLILNRGYQLARDYSAKNGKWPCSFEDLGPQQVVQSASSNGWQMEIDCEQNYIALFYSQGGSTLYRALMLDTGEISSGLTD